MGRNAQSRRYVSALLCCATASFCGVPSAPGPSHRGVGADASGGSLGTGSDGSSEGTHDGAEGAVTPRPAAPAWTESLRLSGHRSHALAKGAPSVVAHAPAGFDPHRPLHLVVFLHGWHGCATVLMSGGPQSCQPGGPERRGWDLAASHDGAGTNSIFVIPQLAMNRRTGNPGRFRQSGFFRGFVSELLSQGLASRLGGDRDLSHVAGVTLLAHSAGFTTALAILNNGQADELIGHVVLYDALYAGPAVFARWTAASEQRRLVSIHTGRGRTLRQNTILWDHLAGPIPESALSQNPASLSDAIKAHRAVLLRSSHSHEGIPAAHMAEVLQGLSLPPRQP